MANDESGENPQPKSQRQARRTKQRAAIAAAMQDKTEVAPRLRAAGRARKLDPDQRTLDENLKRLYGCAFSQQTMEEAAANLGCSTETLGEFLQRYPDVRQKWDDTQAQGVASIRTQLFKNMAGDPANKIAPNPQTAMWMGERLAGIKDPYKEKEISQRERGLELRERDVAAKERLLELRAPADLGSGLPIDIKSLSLPQLMQLLARLRAGDDHAGLTIDAVREPEKTG